MSKQQRASASSDVLSNIVEQFESLSAVKAVGVVLALALAMIAYIYNDFLFGNAVLLYTDIGSDSVNIFYPQWVQMAKLWAQHGALHGFSLETVMGMPTGINMWDPFGWIVIFGGPKQFPSALSMLRS